jgi:biopolymer transport protein ExbD
VSLKHISVNEIQVMDLAEGGALKEEDVIVKKDRIEPLYKDLSARFRDLLAKGAQPGADKDSLPVILVQADKLLPYQTLKLVMRTCGQAGFSRFRFAAKQG